MMNEKTINEQYAYIRTLLEEKRLKEALMQLESLLWQCPDWDLRTQMCIRDRARTPKCDTCGLQMMCKYFCNTYKVTKEEPKAKNK